MGAALGDCGAHRCCKKLYELIRHAHKPAPPVCAVLGFEDCSARTEAVSSSELSLTRPWMKEHEQLAPKAWSFYSFDVTPEDYQVVVNVAAELDASCESACQCIDWCLWSDGSLVCTR